MPQMYSNQSENSFMVLWKTDESLEFCRETALRSHVVFPRGWDSWKNVVKQKQALIARIICMNQLGQGEIFYEQNGKPFLSCGRLSISHSQNFIAVYFSSKMEIGVDIEEPHARIEKIASRFLHPDEKPVVSGVQQLTAAWAVKESLFKKFGGKAAFFSENIVIKPFTLQEGPNQLMATVQTEAGSIEQKLDVFSCNDYILASTFHND
jgi:4'-phosphopantetheinyl transferase